MENNLIRKTAIEFAKYCIHAINLEVADATLQNDFDKFITEQNSHKHGVMQAEASGGAEGAAVGNSAAGKGVSGGINCPNCGNEWDITKHNACQCGAQLRGELLR